MNRSALVAAVAARTGLSVRQSRQAVGAVMGAVTDAVREGREVRLPVLKIAVRELPARQARNPRTGEPVEVDPRPKLNVRPGPALLDALGLSRRARKAASPPVAKRTR